MSSEFNDRASGEPGVIALGILLSVLIALLIGVAGLLGVKVIEHGERLSAIDVRFSFIAEKLVSIEREIKKPCPSL